MFLFGYQFFCGVLDKVDKVGVGGFEAGKHVRHLREGLSVERGEVCQVHCRYALVDFESLDAVDERFKYLILVKKVRMPTACTLNS